MIDNILGNKTNLLVLRFLVRFQNEFFPAEEIAEATGAGLKNVYDSLKILAYDDMVVIRTTGGRSLYKFNADSSVKDLVSRLFEEEKKRLFFRNASRYKTLSEIELRIVKSLGHNLIDILLFGSVAKGRDTQGSDIDLCIIVATHDKRTEDTIRRILLEKKLHAVQAHIFSSEEFLDAHKKGNALAQNIMRDGLSLKIGR